MSLTLFDLPWTPWDDYEVLTHHEAVRGDTDPRVFVMVLVIVSTIDDLVGTMIASCSPVENRLSSLR